MGYSTDLTGVFRLDRPVDKLSIADSLDAWHHGEQDPAGNLPLNGYCQWKLTKNRQGIEEDD